MSTYIANESLTKSSIRSNTSSTARAGVIDASSQRSREPLPNDSWSNPDKWFDRPVPSRNISQTKAAASTETAMETPKMTSSAPKRKKQQAATPGGLNSFFESNAFNMKIDKSTDSWDDQSRGAYSTVSKMRSSKERRRRAAEKPRRAQAPSLGGEDEPAPKHSTASSQASHASKGENGLRQTRASTATGKKPMKPKAPKKDKLDEFLEMKQRQASAADESPVPADERSRGAYSTVSRTRSSGSGSGTTTPKRSTKLMIVAGRSPAAGEKTITRRSLSRQKSLEDQDKPFVRRNNTEELRSNQQANLFKSRMVGSQHGEQRSDDPSSSKMDKNLGFFLKQTKPRNKEDLEVRSAMPKMRSVSSSRATIRRKPAAETGAVTPASSRPDNKELLASFLKQSKPRAKEDLEVRSAMIPSSSGRPSRTPMGGKPVKPDGLKPSKHKQRAEGAEAVPRSPMATASRPIKAKAPENSKQLGSFLKQTKPRTKEDLEVRSAMPKMTRSTTKQVSRPPPRTAGESGGAKKNLGSFLTQQNVRVKKEDLEVRSAFTSTEKSRKLVRKGAPTPLPTNTDELIKLMRAKSPKIFNSSGGPPSSRISSTEHIPRDKPSVTRVSSASSHTKRPPTSGNPTGPAGRGLASRDATLSLDDVSPRVSPSRVPRTKITAQSIRDEAARRNQNRPEAPQRTLSSSLRGNGGQMTGSAAADAKKGPPRIPQRTRPSLASKKQISARRMHTATAHLTSAQSPRPSTGKKAFADIQFTPTKSANARKKVVFPPPPPPQSPDKTPKIGNTSRRKLGPGDLPISTTPNTNKSRLRQLGATKTSHDAETPRITNRAAVGPALQRVPLTCDSAQDVISSSSPQPVVEEESGHSSSESGPVDANETSGDEAPANHKPSDSSLAYKDDDVFSFYSWSRARQDTKVVQKERMVLKESILQGPLYRNFIRIDAV